MKLLKSLIIIFLTSFSFILIAVNLHKNMHYRCDRKFSKKKNVIKFDYRFDFVGEQIKDFETLSFLFFYFITVKF